MGESSVVVRDVQPCYSPTRPCSLPSCICHILEHESEWKGLRIGRRTESEWEDKVGGLLGETPVAVEEVILNHLGRGARLEGRYG